MSLYGNTDSDANVTKAGRGIAASSQAKQTIFIDNTEAALAENKARGLNAPGWWSYYTYTDCEGNTRHKAEMLVTIAEPIGPETQADDAVAADVSVVIAIQTEPVDTAVAVGAALQLVLAATATPPGDASVLTFQWQKKSGKKWANVAGATNTTFDIATYADTDAGSYRVKINSTNGATEKISAVAVVTTA
ncbi:hypothetical protein Np200711_172 [Cyanophage S-RIM44]|uniref:Virion structural protein n=1 Tax=Cyanophage S-RIM44 TaxID=1278485 RepID=A0A1D7SEP8_9CAUD|nr:hypothetical protein Np200711_172 [Cyanophage S-RIM44]